MFCECTVYLSTETSFPKTSDLNKKLLDPIVLLFEFFIPDLSNPLTKRYNQIQYN